MTNYGQCPLIEPIAKAMPIKYGDDLLRACYWLAYSIGSNSYLAVVTSIYDLVPEQ